MDSETNFIQIQIISLQNPCGYVYTYLGGVGKTIFVHDPSCFTSIGTFPLAENKTSPYPKYCLVAVRSQYLLLFPNNLPVTRPSSSLALAVTPLPSSKEVPLFLQIT